MKTTEPAAPARLNPNFTPNTTPRIVGTPQGLMLVEPNIRPRPNTGYHQSEVSISTNPLNRNIMFGASHNIRSGTINVATFITTNGGETWYGRDTLADFNSQRGDPTTVIDKNGTFIYGHLTSSVNFGTVTGMGSNRSTDNGLTWSPTLIIANSGGSNADKEWLGTDDSPSSPYYSNTYMAWTSFAGTAATILFSRTIDGGVSWSTAQAINTAGPSTFSQGTDVQTSPEGNVYVCWSEESRTSPFPSVSIGFAKSTDGGVTFTSNNSVFTTSGTRSASFNGWAVRVDDFPHMAVDKTGGGRNGWTYIVQPQKNLAPAGSDNDIVLHRSTDGGTTWSSGIRVNQDPLNNGKQQFWPNVTVDAGGGIDVMYYDNRNYPSVGDSCEVYMSRSLDGGNTWTDIKVSDHSFKPKNVPGVNSMGDYGDITAGNGKVWPMWMDDRSGFYDVWTSGILTTENFGWAKGTVTNASGGAPISGATIDFTQSVPQVPGTTAANGLYVTGARVDSPGTTVNLTLRARKFGFRDTLLNVTLTRNDTLPRNFAMTPLPSGTLTVHSFITGGAGIRANVRVLFGGSEVANAFTDSVSGLYSTTLPTGSYSVIVDPPSPYATRTFNNVTITANTTTTVDALVRAVVEFSPSAIRDTLAVGGVHTKTLQLTNTTTDSVAFRLSDDVGLDHFRKREPAVQPREFPTPAVEKAKGAPDTEFGDIPTGGGGPDAFGYRWIDSDSSGGPVFNWVDISSVGTPITTWIGTGDDGYVTVPIGLPIPFYGNTYTNLNICTNGFISFTSTSTAFTNSGIPATAEPNNTIYGFWDDLDVRTSGTIYYYRDSVNSRFIVQYNNVPHLTSGGPYSFEIILKPNGEILSQYFNMVSLLNSATIGIENAAGTVGLQVAFNANYVHNNLAIRFFLPDAPWISENPSFGVLPPGSNRNITVTFDATGLSAGTLYPGKIFLDAIHPDVSGSLIIPASLLVQPATQALLILNKTSIAYGATPLNTTRRDSISARNGGAQALSITSITTNNPRYVASPASATIQPGDSTKIYVNYTPNAPAVDTGRVIILSNSQGAPRRDVTLSGSGFGAPRMTAIPDSFFFSRAPGTDTTRANLKIKNPGTDTLRYTIDEGFGSLLAAMPPPVPSPTEIFLPKNTKDTRRGNDQTDGSGGPDAFGYRWIDSDELGGPAYNWFDIKSVGTQITTWTSGTGDDGYFTTIFPGGFTFPFYGSTYTGLSIGSNGNLQFSPPTPSTSYINDSIPSSLAPNNAIYPYWDDLDLTTAGGGTAWYYYDAANQRFIVQWDTVSHYLAGGEQGRYTYQAILRPSGDVVCQYKNMQGTLISSTIGTENATGTVALRVVYNAAYMHNNLALLFTKDAVPWMSTSVTSGTIVPGDSQNVQLRIHPAGLAGGNYSGILRLRGNTSDTANIKVRLQVLTNVRAEAGLIPTEFALNQNYPNPFNPTTKISFALPSESAISLKIYSILGQEVLVLADEKQPAGYYSAEWDGRNKFGNKVASGVYFYRLEAKPVAGGKAFSNLRKMILLK